MLVKLELENSSGGPISQNFYWLGEKSSSYRRLNQLPAATLSVTAKSSRTGDDVHVQVEMRNTGTVVSLTNKLTLLNANDGSRILPAYYSDNYVSLLPGESREVGIEYHLKSANGVADLTLRGWNFPQQVVTISSSGAAGK